jgi:16S rRNA (cytosine1402-N4)-methyltransferase
MLDESLALLLPEGARRNEATIVDATFGAGGHTKEILARIRGRVIALDADPAAFERAQRLGREYSDRLTAVHANFADLARRLDEIGVDEVDGILYDLGLSSLQLADPTRGFSFAGREPLDMRLDPTSDEPSAADLLAALSERELADMIFSNGDERHSRRIARQIVARRERSPLRTTSDLVAAVLSARPREAKRTQIHPATRTFQALRMAVNRDVERLERSLDAALPRLRPGARAVVISFHSGEDRVVKRVFKQWERDRRATVLTRKPLVPSSREAAANPRSRSAKLRAAERIMEDP